MADSYQLAGRTAVITGSGKNIGRAIAVELAKLGVNIVLNGRSDTQALEAVQAEVEAAGSKAIIVVGNAGEKETVERFKAEAEKAFGHVDISISNAARRLYKDFFETTDEDWHNHLNTQLTGAWYMAKAFVPAMRERNWGRIIHVNGPDGWAGGPMRIPHSTAKGGLRTLTKSLAKGLGQYGITVNDVIPAFMETERDFETHPRYADPAYARKRAAEVPIRRLTTVDEFAWATSFLCAERSAGITGIALHVDGGGYLLG
ncbi:MAG TPA: SDR family oxidoreductase [Devosia sp.]|nr:SDR family oxidoreductase [Devosia sp.]